MSGIRTGPRYCLSDVSVEIGDTPRATYAVKGQQERVSKLHSYQGMTVISRIMYTLKSIFGAIWPLLRWYTVKTAKASNETNQGPFNTHGLINHAKTSAGIFCLCRGLVKTGEKLESV